MKPTIGKRLTLFLAAFATLVASMAASMAASAGTATAADRARINATPERVVVNQAYENVRWRVNRRFANGADVTMEHVRSRSYTDSDTDTSPGNGVRGTMRVYEYDRMGKHRVYGVGWDSNYNERRLMPDFIMVKRAARVALSGKRHGRVVNLRAKVRKYNGSYPTWKNHRNVRVIFQRKTPRGWKRARTDKTNRRGVAAVRVHRPARFRYRALVRQTPTVWGDASRAIRR
jgi:opacity protein-like surface antigen